MDGKAGATLLLHKVPGTFADRVLLVGLGKESAFNEKAYRNAIATAVRSLHETGAADGTLYLPELPVKKRGIAWPAGLTLETWAAAGLDWHVFPNSIVLPTFDGALWYRMRPNGRDPDSSIVDIWSLGRFPAGKEPVVTQEVFHGFEAFRGQAEFLEEDFGNIEAVNRGLRSRGFRGPVLNPVQEVSVAHFQEVHARYLRDDDEPARPIGFARHR